MRDIAAALGVAPGGLYYYFPSKEALLYACQDLSLRRLVQLAEDALAARGPVAGRLRDVVAGHLDQTLDELGGSAAHIEFHALPPDAFRDIVAKRDRYERALRALIKAGIDDGVFRPVDPTTATRTLLGALNWTAMWWRPDGALSTRELVDHTLDLFLRGLCPPEA